MLVAMDGRVLGGALLLLLSVAALAVGCGRRGSSASAPTTTLATTTSPPPASGSGTGSTSQGPGALTAEAQQTAAGDIPDNQVFLTFRNTAAGYSIEYPEGWAQRGSAGGVTFADKNNLVRVAVEKGSAATLAVAAAEMSRLKQQTPSLRFDAPTPLTVNGRQMVKVVYSTESAPNPVTDKRVRLVVDRYYVSGPGKHAVVDLGTPDGVDNVDAYRLMIESFAWQ
jgi:hypothetical protein